MVQVLFGMKMKNRSKSKNRPDHTTYSVVRKLGGPAIVARKLSESSGREVTIFRVAIWRLRGVPWFWQAELKKISGKAVRACRQSHEASVDVPVERG